MQISRAYYCIRVKYRMDGGQTTPMKWNEMHVSAMPSLELWTLMWFYSKVETNKAAHRDYFLENKYNVYSSIFPFLELLLLLLLRTADY